MFRGISAGWNPSRAIVLNGPDDCPASLDLCLLLGRRCVHQTRSLFGAGPRARGQHARRRVDVDAVNREIREAGAWVFAGGLLPHTSATVVNAKSGEVLMTDGPFPEGKEHIGGFWVIQAKDLDEALAWASKATVACQGPVEVRPFDDEPGA